MSKLGASTMKNQATAFLKQVVSVIVNVLKVKSMAVKSKTSAMKTRLLLFGLLRNKKVLMSAISHKIHALMGQEKEGEEGRNTEGDSKAIVLYNEAPPNLNHTESVEPIKEDDEYPDLTHSLFDSDDEDDDEGLGNATGSVIDLVRNSKEDSADFSLEDEIDHVADVFIKRFHRQMKMQKLASFKRYQEMLERSI